jgi:hypothetical protein
MWSVKKNGDSYSIVLRMPNNIEIQDVAVVKGQ